MTPEEIEKFMSAKDAEFEQAWKDSPISKMGAWMQEGKTAFMLGGWKEVARGLLRNTRKGEK